MTMEEMQQALEALKISHELQREDLENLRQEIETLKTASHALDSGIAENRETIKNVETSILDKLQSMEADIAQLSDKGEDDDKTKEWLETVLAKYFTQDRPIA